MTKYTAQRNQFERALARLDEALAMSKTELVRDSAVKRFELCFDIAWKLVKSALATRDLICATPRECFEQALRARILSDHAFWFDMVKMRNLTVHTYNEELAEEVYAKLPKASECFHLLLSRLPKEQENAP